MKDVIIIIMSQTGIDPGPPEHRAGALSTEVRKLIESEAIY